MVLCARPRSPGTKTGKTQAEAVTAVLVHHDTDLYDLKIRAGTRTSVIDTTSSHLFFVPGTSGHNGQWAKAGSLKYGTHLRTPGGSDDATVITGWVPRQRDGWMWDLTIPGNNDHDFYIDTIATPVLVHNCTISDETATHIERNHTADGDLNDATKTTWTIGPEDRGRAIDDVLEQDPDGVPNTNGRSGTIHRGVMPDGIGDDGYIGVAPAQDGAYLFDEVEVILNPDGSVRNAYPWAPNIGDQ